MALPTIVGGSTSTATLDANQSKAWPGTTQDDDILLLFASASGASVAVPTGCVRLIEERAGPAVTAGSVWTTVFAIRALGVMPNITVVTPGNVLLCGTRLVRGVPRLLNLAALGLMSFGATAASDTAVSVPGGNTTTDDTLLIQVVGNGTNLAVPQLSGEANPDLQSVTELEDSNAAVGRGVGHALITATKHVASSFGDTTATLANASLQSLITLLLPSQSPQVSPAFIAQITEMLPFGPPYEINGEVFTTLPVLDVDCLVFTQVGPSIPGITPATVLRTVVNLADIEVFRGRNA